MVGGSRCLVRNFHQFHHTHHERRHRPASDHPQDKEEEERRAGRRPRLLRLQEEEERTRRLSFCPDSRTGGFLEHKGLPGIVSYLSKPPISPECDQERVSALVKAVPVESEPQPTSSAPPKSTHDSATTKAYTIINQPPTTARRPPNAPPKVVSHKELLNRTQGVQCYDAVPLNESEDAQAELEKFIPMLEEYLKRTLKAVFRAAHTINICCFFFFVYRSVSDIQPTASGASSTNDYVWDIFYHRTSKSADWNKISQNIGTLYVPLYGLSDAVS